MIQFIKKLFGFKPKSPEELQDARDRMMQECISRCLQSGNVVLGNIDKDGNVHIEEISKGHATFDTLTANLTEIPSKLGIDVDKEQAAMMAEQKANAEANTSDSPD